MSKSRQDLALKIGNNILDTLDFYLQNPKGRYLVAPCLVMRPRRVAEFEHMISFSDWMLKITIDPPMIMKKIPLEGYEFLDLKEFAYEYKKVTGEDPIWEIAK